MDSIFQTINSAETAINFAITLEQRGRDFYRNLYERLEDPKLKTLVSFLAAEEEKHLGTYRQLLDTVNPGAFQQVALVGEYGKYMDILCSEITDHLSVSEEKSISDYMEMALTLEKNTLLAFNEIKAMFDGKDKETIEKICDEEKIHIVKILEYQSDRLDKDKESVQSNLKMASLSGTSQSISGQNLVRKEDASTEFSSLFSTFQIKRLSLKNRITMAPLYLGYANTDGTVSTLTIDHYREMAASGAGLIVVENAAVDSFGLGSPLTLRVDNDRYLTGLSYLAETIQKEGALAFCQINHAGRYAYSSERLAPSPVRTGDVIPREMSMDDIEQAVEAFASGAKRVKDAGFDGVEIHGGTGYLIVQFLSSRTNQRQDDYGGPIENRMRFPLQVVDAVLSAVGKDYPVGYRFLADEGLPDGLHLEETALLAKALEKKGIAYLSVMAGTYDSFFLPEYLEKEKQEAYMTDFAKAVKKVVSKTPIITAGRIQNPATANRIIEQGDADLIGLARVLLADPLWPKKAQKIIAEPIVRCEPACSLCMKRATEGKPAFCSQWDRERRQAFLSRMGEPHAEAEIGDFT